jgi:hypothetical protein
MSAARKFSARGTKEPLAGATTVRDRLKSLGSLLEALWYVRDAMRKGRPLNDTSEILERLRASMAGVCGNFKVEATAVYNGSRLQGWRVTSHDRTTSLQHEFYVHEGLIRHVQFQSSPPWNHSSRYIVGGKVKQMLETEKRAILHTISSSSAGVSDEDDGS